MDETARDRIRALEALVDKLTSRNETLERALVGDFSFPTEWLLSRSEARVLGCVAQREMATKDQIYAALYDSRIDGGVDPKIVDVFVCKLRKKVAPFGVEVLTVWGQGYRLVDRERYAQAERVAA